MKTKVCTKCKKKLPITLKYFCEDRRNKNGYCSECKNCHSKQMKQRYKTVNGHLRQIFNNINRRCNNPKCKDYKYYGGRDIKCLFESSQEFIHYVTNELKIDPRNLEIDRIDNDGNYEPGNLRLVTHKENCNNREKRNDRKTAKH